MYFLFKEKGKFRILFFKIHQIFDVDVLKIEKVQIAMRSMSSRRQLAQHRVTSA